MVEFETIEKERQDYGNYPGEKFIEVSRNKAIQDEIGRASCRERVYTKV